ncbi:MAG: hypothetical protein LBQ02_03390 [Candidatus Nomurabacteria bacterium]|jgi:ABC-type sugar transport system ATPase subunit|nr:hypothetical protein [Candidatus Nomurabacteria bacterium]
MPYITIKNLKKSYMVGEKVFWALKNININIEKGELTVILGPSGAGKKWSQRDGERGVGASRQPVSC